MQMGLPYNHLEIARQRTIRHGAFLTAIARAYVLVDAKAHLHDSFVEMVWNPGLGYPYHPTECQMRYAGAPKAAIARLRQGRLGIEDKLGCWTGEFFHGLKLANALAEKEPGHYRIDTRIHSELVADIKDWILAGRLGRPDRDGRRRLIACPAATHLPAEDPEGAGVIAGLFAGARISKIDGEQWCELPATEATRRLLEEWSVLHSPSRRICRREYLKVSPFYAQLVAELMPEHSRMRIRSIRNPAMCPLLPILYWEWLYAPISKGMRILPFPDALPFGISRRTFYRHGWRRSELHRRAVLEVGILRVDPRLRKQMHGWFEQHHRQRTVGNSNRSEMSTPANGAPNDTR